MKKIFLTQKEHFLTGKTRSYASRAEALERLESAIKKYQQDIQEALYEDLHKSPLESYVSEVHFVLSEIQFFRKKLKSLMKKRPRKAGLLNFPARAYLQPEPLGTILIISPWNYPFQLLISPLVGAIAAGNTVILKPSEISVHTSKIIEKLIQETFDSNYIAVIQGGVQETSDLLSLPFDHIFYTGSSQVGKIVMQKASENLCPVTLELGGKSPCFVFEAKDLELTSRRIVWGKFFNAGQTCIAPDYLLVSKNLKQPLIKELIARIHEFYGASVKESQDFGRIINHKHFDRLDDLIVKEDLLYGGEVDREKRFISPTLLKADKDSKIMEDEIFGPLLPILEFETYKEAIEFVRSRPKPLATYIFSDNKSIIDSILENVSAGGVTINDTLVHISAKDLPFGGVGNSGMGAYHGVHSFNVFSHLKPVLKRYKVLDLELRYPPYKGKLSKLKKLLKWT